MSKFYEEAAKFAKEFVRPHRKATDENAEFPVEVFKELGEHGYFKILIPKEYGGLGLTIKEHQEIVMALAEECPTVGLCYMMSNVALMTIILKGSEELKKKVFSDVVENKKFLALAYSEFGTGKHFYMPEITVKKNGSKTIFNRAKSMVTSATHASYYLILTPAEKEDCINNWIIPINSNGLSFDTQKWHGVGMRGNASCPMQLEDVELDSLWRIGDDGSAMDQVFNIVAPYFILGLASVYTGLNLCLSDITNEYATQRHYNSDKCLANIETVQIHLAKIYAMGQASRALTEEATIALSDGKQDALAKVIAARVVAIENAISSATIAMRVGGGKTYNKATEIEGFMSDAYAGQIMAPSVDFLIVWLGKALTGQSLI